MDVGEYIRNKQKQSNKTKEENNIATTEETLNKYSKMSEEQLMQELFKVGSVSSGNVSARELDSFFNNVKLFLTPEQKEKMKRLIIQLKMQ